MELKQTNQDSTKVEGLDSLVSFPYFMLREPCRKCASKVGECVEKNGQLVVYCWNSHSQGYNIPKAEVGLAKRTVSKRKSIKPNKRARILDRAASTCETCGSSSGNMHIGHIICHANGGDDSDDNLYVACEECNLGRGKLDLPQTVVEKILANRIKRATPRE